MIFYSYSNNFNCTTDCYKPTHSVDGTNMGVVPFHSGLINGKGIIKTPLFIYLLSCIINIAFSGPYIQCSLIAVYFFVLLRVMRHLMWNTPPPRKKNNNQLQRMSKIVINPNILSYVKPRKVLNKTRACIFSNQVSTGKLILKKNSSWNFIMLSFIISFVEH